MSARSRAGKQLGRDSALRLLAAIARSSETDGVTLVGAAGLKAVLPLLTQRPEEGNRAAREAAMEVVRVMCTQHGNPRKQNIVRPHCSAICSPLPASHALGVSVSQISLNWRRNSHSDVVKKPIITPVTTQSDMCTQNSIPDMHHVVVRLPRATRHSMCCMCFRLPFTYFPSCCLSKISSYILHPALLSLSAKSSENVRSF